MAKKRLEFWTVDAETDPFHNCQDSECLKCSGRGRVPEPFIWGAYNGFSEEYLEFSTSNELVKFFESKKVRVYGHNAGRFDWHYLRDRANTGDDIHIIAGRISKMMIGECEFRDSMNIFQQTRLADFGGKLSIDYEKMEPDLRVIPHILEEIKKYLRVDCVDLWNNLKIFR
jgi:hypothetical protein